MPADSGMAFVIISHLAPNHKSILAEILSKYNKMNICQAEDGMKVEPNCVYIIPPNWDLVIMHERLQLLEPIVKNSLRHPIDTFFRSLAKDKKEHAIGIILSGSGNEGVLGIRDIKEEGGIVAAQEISTAKYNSMPGAAIATGIVDYILPPEEMPAHLIKYINKAIPRLLKVPNEIVNTQSSSLQKIFVLIRDYTGNDFSLYKQKTMIRRIERRMAVHQIDRLDDYVKYLQHNQEEVGKLFKELLIRVTHFFRDKDAFNILKKQVLPHLLKDKPRDEILRVWIPACSTGEEAYSIAIIIHEFLTEHQLKMKVQIFATDIDEESIDKSRTGIYPESIESDVSPERMKLYFTKMGNSYKIRDEIRSMLIFANQNVINGPSFTKIDFLVCRNLLIYLGQELQKQLMQTFHYSLKPGGLLFLGSSESIGDCFNLYSVFNKKWKIYERKLGATNPLLFFTFPSRQLSMEQIVSREQKEYFEIKQNGMIELIEKLLLDRFPYSSVLINEKDEIVYVYGKTDKYLELSPGKAILNIVEMSKQGIRLEMSIGLRKARLQKKEIVYESIAVKNEDTESLINLHIIPILEPHPLQRLLLVIFKPVETVKTTSLLDERHDTRQHAETILEELQQELKHTRENLQTTIEELETSNEELKSANEELQSSNEELQSTNEELETSKEELQSVNEELVTVNAELQCKIDELFKISDDLNNLLASTDIATVFLDKHLAIKKFTPAMAGIMNFIKSDLGRPVEDISSNLLNSNLSAEVNEVLDSLIPKTSEVMDKRGKWYIQRILPYRTINNVIDGVVVTFMDITEFKQMESKLRLSEEFVRSMIETVKTPMVVLDKQLMVVSANGAFHNVFKTNPEQITGKKLYDIGNGQMTNPTLQKLLEEIIPTAAKVDNFEIDLHIPGINNKTTIVNASQLVKIGEQSDGILVTFDWK